SVHGYIGNAEISRGSRNRQSIFVNKRYIKSALITAAVENAFKSFLTVHKFPFFVIFLDIFPEYIDINVHPQKTEIKFQQDKLVFKLVFDAVHTAIADSLRGNFDIPEDHVENYSGEETREKTLRSEIYDFNRIVIDEKDKEELEKRVQIPIDFNYKEVKSERDGYSETTNILPNDNITENVKESNEINYDKVRLTDKDQRNSKFPELRIIGQFNKTYIIGEAYDELYLIDQHAAHEKVLFEKYKSDIINAEVLSQILLTPLVIELRHEDYAYYIENEEVFRNSGFDIIEFGENTISIREVPIILGSPDIKYLFNDILDNLKNMGTGETAEIKYNKIASLACKAAVKANNQLSELEMSKLISDLRHIDQPFTCPHGRPTIIKMTLTELEKRFKRIQ
ncbi:MAG: DNA mismatch repair endonuclease MutL, partial [Clostridium sp.]